MRIRLIKATKVIQYDNAATLTGLYCENISFLTG